MKKTFFSLRFKLILWLLIFSMGPLIVISFYIYIQYQKAFESELRSKFKTKAQIVQQKIDSFSKRGKDLENKVKLLSDRSLPQKKILQIYTEFNTTNLITKALLNKDKSIQVAWHNSKFTEIGKDLFLNSTKELNLSSLESKSHYSVAYAVDDLILMQTYVPVYFKEKLVNIYYLSFFIDKDFFNSADLKLDSDFIFLNEKKKATLSSSSDLKFNFNFRNLFQKNENDVYFTNYKNQNYKFFVNTLTWGPVNFIFLLGEPTPFSEEAENNIQRTFLIFIATLALIILITTILISKLIVKPLSSLLQGIKNVNTNKTTKALVVTSDDEIGQLTKSFNEMSESVHKAKSDLTNKVTELEKINLEIRETQQKLVQSAKLLSLGQLVAGIAHELNNPIGFIYSNMKHLKDYSIKILQMAEIAEKNPQKMEEFKKQIDLDFIKEDMQKLISSCEEGARRTREIVVGLRNFSRLDEGKFQTFNLNESLDICLNFISGEIKNRISVVKNYSKLPLFYGQPTQIHQVFINILMNAAQAIKLNGNIWISTALQKQADKDWFTICIKDDGQGISSENLDKVFDPFFSTKEVGKGTGLGLSISYGIIQNHKGEIKVQSTMGVGTEFTIWLPLMNE
jgi:two-component system NtrC family sensor kinase